MSFAGWEVRIVKNWDRGLENASQHFHCRIRYRACLGKKYLLLPEFEVRTVSYVSSCFPLGFMAQARGE